MKEIGRRYGFQSVCYGHAGDGNLREHREGRSSDGPGRRRCPRPSARSSRLTVSLGGTLSGEHGIGLVQRPYMDIAFSQVQLDLMRRVKEAFDPLGILNPGKVLP